MKAVLAALALTVASFGTFAQEATVFEVDAVSAKSRAEVRTELFAALQRGEAIRYGEAPPAGSYDRVASGSTMLASTTHAN